MDNILLKLKSVSSIMGFEEGALLILVDEAESHQLSITCDRYMARQLCLRMKHYSRAHKLLPEVLCRLLHLDDAETSSAYELIIYDIIEGEYKVLLVNNALNTCEKIRASDAILLSLVSQIPLYVFKQIFEQQSTPYKAGSRDLALPLNALTDSMLKSALDMAVSKENYELATHIRDEIKRRKI